MDKIQKMFQTIVNGQSAMKSELLTKIIAVEEKLTGKFDSLDKKIEGLEKRLTARIDKIGLQIARLEDDTPTIEEFDKLEKRVTKVEQKVASV